MTEDSRRILNLILQRIPSSTDISEDQNNDESNILPSLLSSPNKQVRFEKKTSREVSETDVKKEVKESTSTDLPVHITSSHTQLETLQNETDDKLEDDKDPYNSGQYQNLYPRLRVSRRRSSLLSVSKVNLNYDKGFNNVKSKVKSSRNVVSNYFIPIPNRLPTLASEVIEEEEANDSLDDDDDDIIINNDGMGSISESEYEDIDNPYLANGQDVNKKKSSSSNKIHKAPFSPPATLRYKNFDQVCNVGEDGIWDDYGIDVDEQLPSWKSLSIDDLFQSPDLGILAPIERRVEVEDLKFKVVHNTCFEYSLLRAISRAVTGSESNFGTIRKQILEELRENWAQYFVEMSEECGYDVSFLPSMTKPIDFLKKYEEYYRVSVSEPPLFHLQAAASRIGFSFVFFDASNYDDDEVVVHNSRNPVSLKSKDVYVYHFIRTGRGQGSWTYEFLIPLGRPSASTYLEDGSYSIRMFDALLVDRQMSKSNTNERRTSTDNRIRLNRKPMTVFGVDHRLFAYKPTYSCDLWSLLSELLTGKLSSAPVILRECLKERYFQAQYYHFSKIRKRRQVNGLSKRDDLDAYFQRKISIPSDHRGTFEDLEHAAMVFSFSYVAIGMDNNGNFFWKESINSDDDDEPSTRLAFFVAFTTRQPFWHALEEVGRIQSSKSEMLDDITFTDDTLHMRSLYCRTQPCLVIRQSPSWNARDALISVRSGFAYGRDALFRRFGFVSNPVNNVVRRLSVTSVNLLARFSRRILGRLFQRTSRIEPVSDGDDVSLTQIYFRENP